MRLKPVRSIEEVEAYRASLRGREVVVIGAGRSGLATTARLAEAGADVRLADAKPLSELAVAAEQVRRWDAGIIPQFERYEQIADADLVISSPGIAWEHPALVEARARDVETFGTFEFAWRLCASPVVAVTGTNGKGTVCRMLSDMLEHAGIHHILAGNIGLPLAEKLDATAPDVVAILEVSSFQLETIVLFRPRIATLLNLTPDHLDRHPSYAAYTSAKARIFENQRPEDVAVINNDDKPARQFAEATLAHKLRVSLASETLDAGVQGEEFFVRVAGETERICPVSELRLRGRHHMTNALVAALMARLLGAPAGAMAAAIAAYEPPAHHMEPAGEVGGVLFINDSKASNPDSAVADLQAMDRPYIAIVGGKDKGAEFTALGRLLASAPRTVILIGEAADRIEQAMGDVQPERARTLEDAVARACELAEPGDAVIMAPACSSIDMFRDYEQRGEVFRQAVQALREE